ncbi:hypothetical protein GCM10009776_08170 [Microbacterium deminutum]|uniref:Uncharacterized protein n=1 Tax=Microbacterium deminutum TaxID=344164 RepID=A0ABN2QBT9_9MICO
MDGLEQVGRGLDGIGRACRCELEHDEHEDDETTDRAHQNDQGWLIATNVRLVSKAIPARPARLEDSMPTPNRTMRTTSRLYTRPCRAENERYSAASFGAYWHENGFHDDRRTIGLANLLWAAPGGP